MFLPLDELEEAARAAVLGLFLIEERQVLFVELFKKFLPGDVLQALGLVLLAAAEGSPVGRRSVLISR